MNNQGQSHSHQSVATPVKRQTLCDSCRSRLITEQLGTAWTLSTDDCVPLIEQQSVACMSTDLGSNEDYFEYDFMRAKKTATCTASSRECCAVQSHQGVTEHITCPEESDC